MPSVFCEVERLMLSLLLNLLVKLPFRVLYRVADALYLLNRYVLRYRYNVVLNNLCNAFPDRAKDEINAIAERFYRNLFDALVEIIKSPGMTREELERRMTVGPTGPLKDSISQGESCIFLAGHCCNWEWLLLYSSLHLAHPYCVVYQSLHNQRFDDFMLKARTRYGAQAIPANDLARRLVKNRKTLKTLALLADQSPGSAEKKYWMRFLNQDTAFFEGLDGLAKAMNMSVVFVIMKRIKRGHYEVSYKPIAKPPYNGGGHEIVEHYARELETVIRSDPSAWLWSHRRWKHHKPSAEERSQVPELP